MLRPRDIYSSLEGPRIEGTGHATSLTTLYACFHGKVYILDRKKRNPDIGSELLPLPATSDRRACSTQRLQNVSLRRHLNNVLIVDRDQTTLGIVTYSDLFRKVLPTYQDLTEHEEYIRMPQLMEDRVADIVNVRVEEIMTRDVITVSPDLEVVKAGATMIAHHVKQLPVVGDHKKVLGIITHTDIGWGLLMQYAECIRGQGLEARRTG